MKYFLSLFLVFSSLCFAEDQLQPLISAEEIQHRIEEVAKQIDQDYQGQEIALVMIMKGSICVVSDLMRQIHRPCTLDYISTSSYKGTTERGQLTVSGVERLGNLKGKNLLVIDDIFDSGTTMTQVMARLQPLEPKTMKSLVLLYKKTPHSPAYRPDYVLFDIPDQFVLGYGLDYYEFYRNLPAIYFLVRDE